MNSVKELKDKIDSLNKQIDDNFDELMKNHENKKLLESRSKLTAERKIVYKEYCDVCNKEIEEILKKIHELGGPIMSELANRVVKDGKGFKSPHKILEDLKKILNEYSKYKQ